ncbi:MAG: transposase, partial [Aggregatilineaceae bacterium]
EEELPTTLLLSDEESEPPPTRVLDEEQEPEPTRRLPDTGTFEKLLGAAGWDEADRPLPEPPVQHDDTPTVPPHDLEAVRQFLATHSGEADASEFGDVLDAVAQTSPEEYERSPDDRAFHELVESLRTPDMTLQRRTRLEELLASIAADSGHVEPLADSEAAIDYVLDAIRQSGATPESAGTTPDDTTIADVIDRLFEPSFEDVLAALAGEEVDDTGYEEPSYSRPADTRTRPDPTDMVAPDDMAAEEAPAWLAEVEPVEDRLAEPKAPAPPEQFVEPPLTEEDSRHYPATTALAAVSGVEAGDDFSLSQLLAEIEEQLPPVLPRQPRLKPLPSWGKGTRLADARDLEAIFDQLQRATSATTETRPISRPAADEAEPAGFDLTAISQEPGGYETGLPEELRELASSAPDDQADITAIFYNGVRAEAWEFAEVGEEAVGARAAEEIAWEEPAEAEPEWQELATEAPASQEADVYAAEPPPAEEVAAQPEAEPPPVAEETGRGTVGHDLAWEGKAEQHLPPMPGDERLVAVPVAEAARLLQGEAAPADSAEDIDIAQMAVELTQYSLESSAQATMLSRPGRLLAHAGELPPPAIQRAFEISDAAWHKKPPHLDSIFRYITLPEVGEALLYAVAVEGDMVLSLIFAARTSLHTIRRQARRLGESLNLIPELPQPEEPPAARTRPRRPQPPEPEPTAPEIAPAEVAVAEAPPAAPPMVGYTCLWIPHDPRLELRGEFAHELMGWLEEITRQEGWRVQALAIHTDYVQMSLEVPQTLQPDQVIAQLMALTAERSAAEFPDLAFGQPLWADGYYLVTPPRDLSDREIARFITLQRQN